MRHPLIETVTDDIARVIWARDADQTLPERPQRLQQIYVLPIWAWGRSRIDVGRKDRDRTGGGRLDMPIRLDWSIPTIGLVDELVDTVATWSTHSAGYDETGSIDLAQIPSGRGLLDDGLPAGIDFNAGVTATVADVSRIDYAQARETAIHGGQMAYWSMLQRIEGHAEYFAPRAVASLSISVIGAEWGVDSGRLIGDADIQQALDIYSVGSLDTEGSAAIRLIERCLQKDAFQKADPQQVITTAVHRDIKEELRRIIGDPRDGASIRETARRIGLIASQDDEAIEQVRDAYNEEHPGRPIGTRRVEAALRVFDRTRRNFHEDIAVDRSPSAQSVWS